MTHRESTVLCSREITEGKRKRVTVEERGGGGGRGRAGGHEPTCRLGQKLWLRRGEVRRGGILMTQKPARQVCRGGMPQIPPPLLQNLLLVYRRRRRRSPAESVGQISVTIYGNHHQETSVTQVALSLCGFDMRPQTCFYSCIKVG